FEELKQCEIDVLTFSDNWELKKKMDTWDPQIDVVKVPMGMAKSLVDNKFVVPLDEVLDPENINRIKNDYFLFKLGVFMEKVYYIPRKFETRIMVYRKSRLREAGKGWRSMRSGIEAVLKNDFSITLPDDYKLERDPNEWNYLDLLVAGYYWANKAYNETKTGRIAHRGKEYSGTAIGLMDRCFQMGAEAKDILNPGSRYFFNVLFWESVMAGNNLYNTESWRQGWDGKDIWKAMREEKIFLSFLSQIDCYFLHGISDSTLFLKDPEDLGFALMPEAVLADGKQKGSRSISTGGWFWGIGSTSTNPGLAFELITFITNRENQLAECRRFGMIPVRNDILKAAPPKFDQDWKIDIYNISLKQLRTNKGCRLPPAENIEEVEKAYIGMWKTVLAASRKTPVKQMQLKFLMKRKKQSGK
ncbi:extracellular solute-binding protein, partial [Fibrobacterota bacterium]